MSNEECYNSAWLPCGRVIGRWVQGPFTYEALSPADISFRPLKQTREFNAGELLQASCPP